MEELPKNLRSFLNKTEELDKEIKSLEDEISTKDKKLMGIDNSILFVMSQRDDIDRAIEESEKLQMDRLNIERHYKELEFKKNELIAQRDLLKGSTKN